MMGTCRNTKSHFLLIITLFTIAFLLSVAGSTIAQVTVNIDGPESPVYGAPGANTPVTFTITITTDGNIADIASGAFTLLCSPDDAIFDTPFPLGEICPSGNDALTTIAASPDAKQITISVYPAKDCSLQLRCNAETIITDDDPPATNEEDTLSDIVQYIDAPRTLITPISSDPTNSPTVLYNIQFSKPVDGFATDDIVLEPVTTPGIAGGTKTVVLAENSEYPNSVFTAAISGMTYNGNLQISVPPNSATSVSVDTQGNWYSVDSPCDDSTISYDGVPPATLTVTRPTEAPDGDGLVKVSTLSATYTTDKPIIDIRGSATDDLGIDKVTWSNDRGGSGNCSGTTSWRKNGIYLAPGQNIITITVYDLAGNTLSYTITVNCLNEYLSAYIDDGRNYAPTITIGLYSSLALDSDGYPRISYYDSTNKNLKYAAWDGESWHIQTVDGSASDVGMYTSLKLDTNDNPCISYYDETNTDLRYAYYKNGVWKISIVDGTQSSSDVVGTYTSLALDSSGRPRIAYYDVTNKDLLYAVGSSADNPTWTICNVDVSADAGHNVGQYTSLALDSSDRPRISYYDVTNGNLKYVEASNATTNPTWTEQVVESTNDVGQFSSLVLDSSGRPHIAYYDNTNKDLRYAEGATATNPWWYIITAVDTVGDVGQYCSLSLDLDYILHISYFDSTGGNLKLARSDEGHLWVTSILDDGQAEASIDSYSVGQYTSLAVDSDGKCHVSYQDSTNESLKYIYCTGTADFGQPTCLITAPASPTITTPVFTVTFSEDVSGFVTSDVVVQNGFVSSFVETTPNKTWQVTVTPYADGTVSCYVPAGMVTSAAHSQSNIQSNTASVVYNMTSPGVTINQSYDQEDPTNDDQDPIHFSIIFTEPVYGFTADDVVMGGTAGSTSSIVLNGAGSHYDLEVTPDALARGAVIASVPANVATNIYGNGNTASSSSDNSVWYDSVSPTCSVAAATISPTTSAVINYTVTFSEPVVGFAGSYTSSNISSKLSITGSAAFSNKQAEITSIGTADQYKHYSAYNVAIRGMQSSGSVIVSVPAGAAYDCDSAGNSVNPNIDSTNFASVYYNSQGDTGPTVLVNRNEDQVDPTQIHPIVFDAVFSAPVTGFTASDVIIEGTALPTTAVLTNSGDNTHFTISVDGMTASGSVIARIPAGVAFDEATGKPNKASESTDNNVQYYLPLEVSVSSDQSSPTSSTPVLFKATFSKAVSTSDFIGSDVTVTGSAFDDGTMPVVTVANADSTFKVFNISVSAMRKSGNVTISIPAGVVTVDGFGNLASGSVTIEYEAPSPTVEVTKADGQNSPTNASVINFKAQFSQDVTGFSSSGVTVSGAGATTATISGSGATYNIAVSGMSEPFGVVKAVVNAGAAFNADGIGNAASTGINDEVIYDKVRPDVVISRATGQGTTVYDAETVNYSVAFSEAVNGFTSADIVINSTAGATTAVVTGSGAAYSVAVSGMTTDGTVAISIPASSAADDAGNTNTASTGDTLVTFYNKPSVTINQSADQKDPTSTLPINFTVIFGEPVTDFDDSDDIYTVLTNYSDTLKLTGTPVPVCTEIVPGNDIGKYGYFIFDSSNNPHVCYLDATADKMKYATGDFTNMRWSTNIADGAVGGAYSSLAITSTGEPRISYYDATNGCLKYSSWDGQKWVPQVVDDTASEVGLFTSLQLNSVDSPGISYNDLTNTNLKYAYYSNGAWNLCIVDGDSDTTDSVGAYSSLAFDSDKPCIAYYDETNKDLLFAKSSKAKPTSSLDWTIYTVDSRSTTDTGKYASLVLDSSGKPCISYYDATNKVLRYAVGNAASPTAWTIFTADDGVVGVGDPAHDVGQYSSLALDSTGCARISYYDSTDMALKYAQADASAEPITWTKIVADDVPVVEDVDTDLGKYSCIALDSSGIPAISYYDATNGSIKFAVGDAAVATEFTNLTMTDGTTYNVAISGISGQGTVTVSVPANVVADSFGIKNTASTSTDNQVEFDTVGPTPEISLAQGQASPTSNPFANFTVTFPEPITGFEVHRNDDGDIDVDDVVLTGSAVPAEWKAHDSGWNYTITKISNTAYNVAVTGMTTSGGITLQVAATSVKDVAGNDNTASTTETHGETDTVVFDLTPPVAYIDKATGQDDPTNALPIKFAVTLSEPVISFTTESIDLSESTADIGSVLIDKIDPLTYEVVIDDITHSGSVVLNIPEGSLQDEAGCYNENLPDDANYIDNVIIYDDQTDPTVTVMQIVDVTPDHELNPATNVLPINFIVTFSEPVMGFGDAAEDVSVSGSADGTKDLQITEISPFDGTTYNVEIDGLTDGTVQLDVPAGVATDMSGINYNEDSTGDDNIVTYDSTNPGLSLALADGQDLSVTPIVVVATFSEPVSGFDPGDVILSGTANPSSVIVSPNDGLYHSVYDIAVSGMMNSGTIMVSVPAGAAQDKVGNLSLGNSLAVPVDFTWPGPSVTVEQATTQADPTNAATVYFTAEFSESVTGFDASDVAIGGTAEPSSVIITGTGTTYSIAVSGMTQSGTVTASIPVNSAFDSNNNGNSPSTSTDNSIYFDNVRPSVTINKADGQADPTKYLPIAFKVVFSEPVTGFTKDDVSVAGTAEGTKTVTVTDISPSDGTTYSVVVSGITSNGTVIATISAGVARDVAGNYNTASSSTDNAVTYDRQPVVPTITLATGFSNPTNKAPITINVVFSADVDDFETGDVILSGTAGAVTAVVAGSGKNYTVTIDGMTKSGTVIASIEADVVHNADGDANTAASLTVNYDGTKPTVTILSPTSEDECVRNASKINITGTASDDTQIANVKWATGNGSTGTCTGTTSWSASGINISSTSDTITVTVTDSAGNKSTDTLSVTINEKAPADDQWVGLAMVSVPIIPDETDPKVAVGFYANCWVLFDTSANDYVQYPDTLTWFDPAENTPGRGFWAKFTTSYAVPYGIIPDQTEECVIHLKRGWNLIGNPFVTPVVWDPDEIQVEYNGIRTTLREAQSIVGNYAWGWDSVNSEYYLVYDKSIVEAAEGELSTWSAFWMKATAECDLILPGQSTALPF